MKFTHVPVTDVTGYSYTRLKLLSEHNPVIETSEIIDGDQDNWKYTRYQKEIIFKGRKHFIKTKILTSIIYRNKKLFGDNFKTLNNNSLELILNYFKCDWFINFLKKVKNHQWNFTNNTIVLQIIKGKITNEEDLIKKTLKISYKTDRISYRTFKNLIFSVDYSKTGRLDFLKLLDFTKNPEESLKYYLNCINQDEVNLMIDLLECASKLDERIDFKWSLKRKNLEHNRQIDTLMKIQLENKNPVPIYENDNLSKPNIRLLNTEADVFKESSLMHNCLYSCYWGSIKSNKYLAFSIDFPERCTLGIKISSTNKPVFDQVHTIRNGEVSLKTLEIVQNFTRNLDLSKFFQVNNIKEKQYNIKEEFFGFDIPW